MSMPPGTGLRDVMNTQVSDATTLPSTLSRRGARDRKLEFVAEVELEASGNAADQVVGAGGRPHLRVYERVTFGFIEASATFGFRFLALEDIGPAAPPGQLVGFARTRRRGSRFCDQAVRGPGERSHGPTVAQMRR